MPKMIKFWHQWSWAAHIAVWIIMGTAIIVSFKDGVAKNSLDISEIQMVHKDENMAMRMVRQEQITQDVNDRLSRSEMVQGKIFDRINQIADRNGNGQ